MVTFVEIMQKPIFTEKQYILSRGNVFLNEFLILSCGSVFFFFNLFFFCCKWKLSVKLLEKNLFGKDFVPVEWKLFSFIPCFFPEGGTISDTSWNK